LPNHPVELLIDVAPDWADVTRVHADKMNFDAIAERASGTLTRLYELSAVYKNSQVSARERTAKLLPKFCPDRHVNDDGSFCLGLRAGEGISESKNAIVWWEKLKLFLLCQETAHETGQWPPGAELSHDVAGEIEERAEEIARSIGRLDDYRNAVRFNTGPIVEGLIKINRSTRQLRNGRSACVCGRADRRGRSLLRRDCHKLGCPIEFEYARRLATDHFWESMKGKACCGSMRNCPLKPNEPTIQSSAPVIRQAS
jgi:hypothetical protein